jgi:hypothetical protein
MPPDSNLALRLLRKCVMYQFLEQDQLQSVDIVRLYDHWSALRRGREFPAKGDIDPSAIVSCLPFLSIAEIHREPLRIRYRLVGTEIVRLRGGDPTWKWMHELGWSQETVAEFLTQYDIMLRRREPIFGVDDILWIDGRPRLYEWALLPLSDDGTTITHCIVIEDLRASGRPLRSGPAEF